MFSIERDVDVGRAPEEVFDFVADVRNEVEWNPLIKSVNLVSGEPIQDGSRFDVVRKGSGPSRMTITQFERPTSLATRSTFRGGEYSYAAQFEPRSSGTHVHERVELTQSGPMKLFGSMIRKRLNKEVAETSERMKRAVESQPKPVQEG